MPDFSVFRPRDEKESRFFKWTFLLFIIVFIVLAVVLAIRIWSPDGESSAGLLDWFFWWPALSFRSLDPTPAMGSGLILLSLVWWMLLSAVIADILMLVRRFRLEKRSEVVEAD
ncbi:MAG: hypothetical protein ACE5QW_05430 [Thermoplasmata archaeon]